MTQNQIRWRKSSFSGGSNGDCVELAHTLTAVRDSKNPAGAALAIDAMALVTAVKSGILGR
ncbi:DUF397 domain-containing protein [Actinokineospora auranticolor]|uniref:Uncharacterized protein DUF397 n=1 Tax=Actinokineospora auranticolor TaxID=155976 RepID=A0A2S6H046_9PSEU|nr:DUF397 domain-containing protein [Actinokineospora auranticolor]PPK70854.1 uncharacterized protein DUF397 [Actinokineospora auranticolor]